MAKKQERVPAMREPTRNREQRRHPEVQLVDEPLARDEHPPKELDVPDPRTGNNVRKKKTAENRNQ